MNTPLLDGIRKTAATFSTLSAALRDFKCSGGALIRSPKELVKFMDKSQIHIPHVGSNMLMKKLWDKKILGKSIISNTRKAKYFTNLSGPYYMLSNVPNPLSASLTAKMPVIYIPSGKMNITHSMATNSAPKTDLFLHEWGHHKDITNRTLMTKPIPRSFRQSATFLESQANKNALGLINKMERGDVARQSASQYARSVRPAFNSYKALEYAEATRNPRDSLFRFIPTTLSRAMEGISSWTGSLNSNGPNVLSRFRKNYKDVPLINWDGTLTRTGAGRIRQFNESVLGRPGLPSRGW